MTSYHWLAIAKPSDYDQLAALVAEDFAAPRVISLLKTGLSSAIRGVLVETDYVDKDYRSTYYNFYAKKGRQYRDDCVRLHFFDELVSYDKKRMELKWPYNPKLSGGGLDLHYFGFMVLRPTLVWTIGRTVLSPNVRSGALGVVIKGKHRIHLLGNTLSVWGFPSMDQHSDIAVCAHTACWSILRHYSSTFAWQKEYLVHDITRMAHQFDPGGLVPSNGLDIFEAERIFQAAGAFPLVVTKTADRSFYRQFLAYLESGLPLFVAMPTRSHAIAAIGHSWASPAKPISSTEDHAWDQVEHIIVVDDNMLPYHSVPKMAGAGSYSTETFHRFIVALPDKIYYPAEAVEQHSKLFATLAAGMLDMPGPSDLVRRYFVTSIASLRKYAQNNRSQFGDFLVAAIMELRAAQFVWVVEYATADQWARNAITCRAILDATASLRDPNPVWMAHDKSNALFFDRTPGASGIDIVKLGLGSGVELGRMEHMLKPIVPQA